MDRISINNLFPGNNDFKPLDVYSLYHTTEQKVQSRINFNIDKLINLREDRKKKILFQYKKIFERCLNKINLANNMDKFDIIYQVPNAVYGYIDYNSIDCLQYLQERLLDMYFDTILLSDKSIHVSWKNLKKNRMDDENRKKELNNTNN